MSKWKEKQFNEFILKYLDFRGKTPKKLGMDWGNGNIAALSANNVGKGKIDFAKECYFGSEALYKKWMNKGDCEKDDVLMTMEAPLGNIAQIPDNKKYILSQRTILFKTKRDIIHNNFLFQKLLSSEFQNSLYRNSTGSTVIGIQQKKLDKIKINLPPLPHQRKIARILTTIDNVIEKTESAIAKYKAIKQGMMHDLFSRGIDTETGKLRPTKEEAPHLYKKTELGWIPKEWEVEKLEDLGSIISGGTPSSITDEFWNGEIIWITPSDLSKLHFPETVYSERKITMKGLNNSSATLIPKNSLVISSRAPIGYFAIVNSDFCTNQGCKSIKYNNDQNVYFHYYNMKQNIQRFKMKGEGTTFSEISKKEIEKFLISTATSSNEQLAISEKLFFTDKKIRTEQKYLSKLQKLKQGLMQDLLTGKKEVEPDKDDYDE